MIGAFFLVTLRTWTNRFVYRIKKLRELRYLVGALGALAYFWVLFFREGSSSMRGTVQSMTIDIGAILILALMLFVWILPGLSSFDFSEAEMHFLFTAPVTRMRILLYKMIRMQPQILIGVLVGALLRVPNGYLVGLWATWIAMAAYSTLVSIVRERLRERGVPVWLVSLCGLIAAGLIAWALVTTAEKRGETPSPWHSPLPNAILFVPRFISWTLFSRDPLLIAWHAAVLLAAGGALLWLASRLRVNFNELVMSASERMAKYRARMSGGERYSVSFKRLRPLFALRDGAPAEIAIFWKNSIALMRIASPWFIVIGLIMAALLIQAFFIEDRALLNAVGGFAIGACILFPLLGSKMFQQDFRMDVTRLDVVKTWPVSGERLVAAELAAPLAAMSIVELALLLWAWVILSRGSHAAVAAQSIVIALLIAVPVCALQLMLRNAVPLFLPGWSMRPREEQRGIANAGPGVLAAIANLFALFFVLGPAAAVAAGGYWIATQLNGSTPLVLAAATMPAVFVLAGELRLGLKLLGMQYDRMDVSRDLEPGAA